MSSESSFDGQTFNEFDDFLPKPLSTDSESDHVDPEPTGTTTSFQAPLISVPTSSQTSMVPSTPGISESFFSLEIAPVQSTDCSRARKRMGRPHKRIYPRRLTVGISNTREDASAKLQDPTPKMSKPTSHKFLKTHPHRGYTSKFRFPPRTYPRSVRFSQTDTKRIAATPTGMRIPLTILLLSYRTVEQHLISCHELYAFSSIMLQGIILAVLLEITHGVME